jgi:hypothetical protein
VKQAKIHALTVQMEELIETLIASNEDPADRAIQLAHLQRKIQDTLDPTVQELMPQLEAKRNDSEKGQRMFKVKLKGALFKCELPMSHFHYSDNEEWRRVAARKTEIEASMVRALLRGDNGAQPAKFIQSKPPIVTIYPEGRLKPTDEEKEKVIRD